jgi:hypothetical protein
MLRVERESLNSTTSRERLQKALETAGYPVRLTVEVGRVQDSPAKRNAAAAAQRAVPPVVAASAHHCACGPSARARRRRDGT